MKKISWSLLFWLALLLPSVIPAAAQNLPWSLIEGEDDRILVEAQDYPWGAIGRLNSTLGPFCTGTLVGPRQVLTAAHCLWNKRTGSWLPPCALHFLLGYQRSDFLSHSLVVAYRLEGAHLPGETPGPPELTRDWAVLTLAEDLGKTAKAIPTAPLDPELLASYRDEHGEFVQAGYSRDRAHLLTAHENCRLDKFAANNRLVLHDCDATFGDSGSPILLRRNGTYHIVALHLAIDDDRAMGIALTGAAFHDRLQAMQPPETADGEFKACQALTQDLETMAWTSNRKSLSITLLHR